MAPLSPELQFKPLVCRALIVRSGTHLLGVWGAKALAVYARVKLPESRRIIDLRRFVQQTVGLLGRSVLSRLTL